MYHFIVILFIINYYRKYALKNIIYGMNSKLLWIYQGHSHK